MVSVIIPAFNEEVSIGRVVSSVIGHPRILEVIVVDDGSKDKTATNAENAGAFVIRLPRNTGKGNAMARGVEHAKNDIILFLDADVIGMTHKAISQIIDPVLSGEYSMFVGLRSRKVLVLNRLLRFFPILGGDRAISKSLWLSIPPLYRSNFKVEIASNYFAKQTPLGMGFVLIRGVEHITKEKKYGIVIGLARRLLMIWDVSSISFKLYIVGFFKKIVKYG